MKLQPGTKLMSTGEVADKLGVHRKLVLRYVKNLGLPAYRFGKEFRYIEAEVDAWIQNFRHEEDFDPDALAKEVLKRIK